LWGDCSINSCKNSEEWWETILGVPSLQGMICDFYFHLGLILLFKNIFGLIFVNNRLRMKILKAAITSNGAMKIMGMKEMQPLLDRAKEYIIWRNS